MMCVCVCVTNPCLPPEQLACFLPGGSSPINCQMQCHSHQWRPISTLTSPNTAGSSPVQYIKRYSWLSQTWGVTITWSHVSKPVGGSTVHMLHAHNSQTLQTLSTMLTTAKHYKPCHTHCIKPSSANIYHQRLLVLLYCFNFSNWWLKPWEL